jgi:hypothetical protein
MRQLVLAAGVVCAVAAQLAPAQNQSAMPGQVVSSTVQFNRVGTTFPQVGARVGEPLNVPANTPFMRRANLNDPFDAFRGTNLDGKNVIAPVTGLGNQNALERFYDKLKSAVGLATQDPLPPPPTVTPGIFRRNRERAKERMWRRD